MTALFSEPDHDRLVRRIAAVTAGDLTSAQITKLVDGDVELMNDLPTSSKQKVAALVTPARRGELEKMVGATTDFVPIAFLERARVCARAVARVIDGRRRPLGTGVMVSPRLFMTNNHVVADAQAAACCSVQFNYELAVDDVPEVVTEYRLEPATFFWTSPDDELDASLIAIGPRTTGDESLENFGWAPMSSAADKHAAGDFVTVIQHPDADYKQIALRENRVIGRGKDGVTVYYKADTLRGSSGSPVFNDEWALVALHHAGGPRNDSLLEDGEPVPEDSNEGIRISSIVNALRERHDMLPAGFRDLLAETLNPPAAVRPVETAAAVERTPTLVSADLHLPLLRISDGGVSIAAAPVVDIEKPAPVAAFDGAAVERNDAPDDDYDGRRGYDAEFLSQPVAVPTVPPNLLAKCAVPKGMQRSEYDVLLRYHHFSLVMHANRRMPLFTVVNIDGRRARKINRQSGEADADTWFIDRRLDPAEQLSQDVFDNQRLLCPGHIVRRLDPAWGSPAAAKLAADDTFHFTDCCPQTAAFNQSLWQGIEDYARDNAGSEKRRITVITGPVFGTRDPKYRGIAVPRRFWKIVVRVSDTDCLLRATGFLADQSEALGAVLGSTPGACTDVGKVAIHQKSIAELERLTGLSFNELKDHDTLGAGVVAGSEVESLDEVSW